MTESEKQTFELLRHRFIEWLGACNYSIRTSEEYEREIKFFIKWVDENTDVTNVNEILPKHLNQYQVKLCGVSSDEECRSLSIKTQAKKLAAIRSWFDWLVRDQQLLLSPASSLQMPRIPQRLPKNILTQAEARMLLESTPIENPLDIRDRAMLEIMYGSGMRREELRRLTIYDIDFEEKTIIIERGKGGGSRLVPLTEAAGNALKLYMEEGRPGCISNQSGSTLFLSGQTGGMLCAKAIEYIVHKASKRAGITKKISPHTLRHSCATHLLQQDADIRHIQRLLGHRKLSTTEIYTQVEISDLHKVIENCHPRERGGPEQENEDT